MSVLATVRPDSWNFPLFVHVLGAMILVGGLVAGASALAFARGDAKLLRLGFWSLMLVSFPGWVLMRLGAQWIYSQEGFSGDNDPTWLGIGFAAADIGLLVLLVTIGVAYWWRRSGKPLAGHIVAGLSTVYLLLLAVAWLAMAGKWG